MFVPVIMDSWGSGGGGGQSGNSFSYIVPGSYLFTVPTYTTLTAQVIGGAGCSNSGSAGNNSTFNTSVIGGGGGAGQNGQSSAGGGSGGAGGAGGTASGGSGDPYLSSLSLAMHMDGTNGSTTFTDLSGHTFTPVGAYMKISTTQSKFGGASASFYDGIHAVQYLSAPASNDFNITTGDFTVRAWVFIAGNSQNDSGNLKQACICSYNTAAASGSNYWFFLIEGSNSTTGTGLSFYGNYSGVDHVFRAASAPVSQNAWHFLEAGVHSGTGYLFIDGVHQTITTNNYISGTVPNVNPLLIGYEAYSSYKWNLYGYIDDLQIYKGVCLNTADYSVPTSAFSSIAAQNFTGTAGTAGGNGQVGNYAAGGTAGVGGANYSTGSNGTAGAADNGAGYAQGAGGSGGGGGGGEAIHTYAAGELTPGATVPLTVGSGCSHGSVLLTWT